MTYAGTHGTAIDAYVAAGAKGIVVGAMAPGYVAPIEFEKLAAAAEKGSLLFTARALAAAEWPTSHRAACPAPCSPTTYHLRKPVLLAVALTKTDDPAELQRIFDEY